MFSQHSCVVSHVKRTLETVKGISMNWHWQRCDTVFCTLGLAEADRQRVPNTGQTLSLERGNVPL